MNKVKVMSGLALASLSVGAGLVKADETKPVAPNPSSLSETKEVSREQGVDQVKASLDKAFTDVKEQEALVNAIKADKVKASDAVNEMTSQVSKAEELVKEATPQGIAKANEDVASAQEDVSQAEKTLEKASQAVEAVTKPLKAQEDKVVAATNDLNLAKEAVTTSKAKVATAQAVLDGTNEAKLIEAANTAQSNLSQAQKAKATAQEQLVIAQEIDANREQAIRDSQQAVENQTKILEQAQANLTNTQEKVTKVHGQLTTAQEGLMAVQERVTQLENEVKNQSTIVVPEGYKEALREFHTSKTAESRQRLIALTAEALATNRYHRTVPFNRKDVIEDPRRLSEADRTELTQFAADLLNQVRRVMGTQEIFANVSAIAFADEVANTSKDTALAHDVVAINKAAQAFGLESLEGYNLYENLGYGYYSPGGTLTKDFLKDAFYRAIVNMLFKDDKSDWGHAFSLAGLGEASRYLGVDVGHSEGASNGRVHLLGVRERFIKDRQLFDQTANLPVRDLKAELAKAKVDLVAKEQVVMGQTSLYEGLKTSESQARSTLSQAQVTLDQAKQAFNRLASSGLKTPEALATVEKANKALSLAQEEHDNAQKALSTVTADVATKKANLDQAKAALSQKEKALSKAQTAQASAIADLDRLKTQLNQAKEAVVKAQTTLDQAKTQLEEKKGYVKALATAPALLEEAKEKLSQAKEKLATATKQLDDALNLLTALQAKEAQANNHYQSVLSAYKILLATQEEVKSAKEKAIRPLGHPSPIASQTADAKSHHVPAKQLPETGERQTGLMSLGIMMLATIGIVFKKKVG